MQKQLSSMDNSFKAIAAGFAGGFAFTGVTQGIQSVTNALATMGKTGLEAYAYTERLTFALQSMSGRELFKSGQAGSIGEGFKMAAGRAKELVAQIEKMAILSPFGEKEIADAFRLAQAYGFTSNEALRMTQAFTDFAAGTGQTGFVVHRISLALGQMQARGKVTAQELNQLSEAGINAREILAQAFGVSTAKLMENVEKGAVGATEAIKAIMDELEGSYKGAAALQAGTIDGMLNSLGDLAQFGLRDLLAGSIEAAQPYLEELVTVLTAPEFRTALLDVGETLGQFTGDQLAGASTSLGNMAASIEAMSKAQAPGWVTGLAAAMGSQAEQVTVDVKGEITTVFFDKAKDWGLSFDAESKITTIDAFSETTGKGLKLVYDAKAGITEFDYGTEDFSVTYDAKAQIVEIKNPLGDVEVALVADWKQGSLVKAALGADPLFNAYFDGFKVFPVWAADAFSSLATEATTQFETYFTGFTVGAAWGATVISDLYTDLTVISTQPIGVTADWAATVISDLWTKVQSFFTANPFSVGLSATPQRTVGSEHSGHANHPRKPSPVGGSNGESWPIDINSGGAWGIPFIRQATGSDFFQGGLALVGEFGPELVSMPRGTQVLNNRDTRSLLRGNVPAFAEGNTGFGDTLRSFLKAIGLWKAQGPAGGGDYSVYGSQMAQAAQKPWEDAAGNVEDAFVDAADNAGKALQDTLKGALGKTPGLFGTSDVTADQMRLAEMGIPQNFADDWLRQLSDEVLNGVDWQGVDIKDAAARAGIDPNLPATVILEMVKNAWNDSSLFANPENLDLINMDAVRATVEKQLAAAQGQSNIMGLFGLTDEGLQGEIDNLSSLLSSGVLSGLEAADIPASLETAFAAGGPSIAKGLQDGVATPENIAALWSMGQALANNIYKGIVDTMALLPVVIPSGTAQPPAPAPGAGVPQMAVGSSYAPGGLALVGEYGRELVELPRGSKVHSAGATAGMLGGNVTINASVSSDIDIDQMAYRVAKIIGRRRG
jgi:tape measure domain-containing protein